MADQDRATLAGNLERVLEQVSADKESRRYGQQSLFGEDTGELPRYALEAHEPWPQTEVLRMEKEALGMFFSGHPLDEFREVAVRKSAVPLAELGSWAREGAKGERKVTVIGVVGEVREIQTRGGRQMAFAALEDLSGAAELVIFADPFSASRELLGSGTVVAATGTVDRSRGEPKVLVDTVCEPHQLPDRIARALHLRLDSTVPDDRLLDLRERCMVARGDLELFIHCMGGDREWVIRANHLLRVDGAPEALARLREIPEVNEAWTE